MDIQIKQQRASPTNAEPRSNEIRNQPMQPALNWRTTMRRHAGRGSDRGKIQPLSRNHRQQYTATTRKTHEGSDSAPCRRPLAEGSTRRARHLKLASDELLRHNGGPPNPVEKGLGEAGFVGLGVLSADLCPASKLRPGCPHRKLFSAYCVPCKDPKRSVYQKHGFFVKHIVLLTKQHQACLRESRRLKENENSQLTSGVRKATSRTRLIFGCTTSTAICIPKRSGRML